MPERLAEEGRGFEMRRLSAVLLFVLLTIAVWPQQQTMSTFDRNRAKTILQVVAGDVRKHYYDPRFHGVNWDAKVEEARHKLRRKHPSTCPCPISPLPWIP